MHGMSKTRMYRRHCSMLQRCFNPNATGYAYYGGRDPDPVTVCDYYCDFVNWFADWGVPGDGLSMDRINNDRGYEPGNLRWADAAMQVANRRRPKTARKAVKQPEPPPLEDPPF